MRKLFCLSMLSLLLVVKIVWAQAPVTIQGVATDSQGLPLPDGERSITFSIYEFQESKTPLWSEQHIVAIKDGLFSATLGNVNPLNLTIDKPYWLGMKIGDDAEMSPRLKLITTGANSVASASGQTASKTTAGPGGSNTGLDAAYDEGSTITTDAGAVNIEGAGGLTVEGSIGVGTTTPAAGAAIHLKDGRMRISHGSNAPGFTLFDDADGDFFRLQHQRSGDQFEIRNSFDAVVFMVEKTGEVGIGTATPSAKLDVVGNTELNGDVDINSDLKVDGGTLFVDGTNDRVGVGTTNPIRKLDINGNLQVQGGCIHLGTSGTGEGICKTDGDLAFYEGTGSGVGTSNGEVMRIREGKVGIGTTSPNAPLDIFNTSGVRIGGSTSKFITLDTFGTGNDIRTVGGDLFIEFLRSNAVDILNGFLRINTNGNIGIGTTSPGGPLHIATEGGGGPVTAHGIVITAGDASSNPAIEIRDTDGTGLVPYIDFSNDGATDFDMRLILLGDNTLAIEGGNLGIGTGGELMTLWKLSETSMPQAAFRLVIQAQLVVVVFQTGG